MMGEVTVKAATKWVIRTLTMTVIALLVFIFGVTVYFPLRAIQWAFADEQKGGPDGVQK